VNENEHVIAITAHCRLQLLLIHRNVPSSYIIHVALVYRRARCVCYAPLRHVQLLKLRAMAAMLSEKCRKLFPLATLVVALEL
jgi:hypothetical protein